MAIGSFTEKAAEMERDRTIDRLRGVNILGMVLYSLLALYSYHSALPWIWAHNDPKALHPGDFVLPVFLFASGMSLVFYERKRRELSAGRYLLQALRRIGKFFFVWAPLSVFTTYHFLGMDELALNLALFIPCALLVKLPRQALLGLAVGINVLHIVLLGLGVLPDFTKVYLGGFTAVPFFMPIMLAGAVFAMDLSKGKQLLLIFSFVFFVGAILAPPYKMELYPSFISLSVILGVCGYFALRPVDLPRIEYLGRTPLRFWLLMLLFFFCPVRIHAWLHKRMGLSLPWQVSLSYAVAALLLLYLCSRALDHYNEWGRRLEQNAA